MLKKSNLYPDAPEQNAKRRMKNALEWVRPTIFDQRSFLSFALHCLGVELEGTGVGVGKDEQFRGKDIAICPSSFPRPLPGYNRHPQGTQLQVTRTMARYQSKSSSLAAIRDRYAASTAIH